MPRQSSFASRRNHLSFSKKKNWLEVWTWFLESWKGGMENLLGVPYTLGMFVFKKKNFLWLQVFKYLNLNTKK